MKTDVSPQIIEFLRSHDFFYIIGHVEPDGDCIGAQLALVSLLRRLGKKAVALQEGPFDRPETEVFTASFANNAAQDAANEIPPVLPATLPAVVVLDCSTSDRVSERHKPLFSLPVLVIDHHAAGEAFGDLRYVDPTAASTTMLVTRLYRALESTPTHEEAALLFFGLATDTGFFRHCEKNCAEVFAVALSLIEQGASPKETYRMMYGNRSFSQRRLLGRLLEKAESLFEGKLVLTSQTLAEREAAGPNVRSSDELYNLFQTVKGVEVIVFLREESEQVTSIGLRSHRSIDVSGIALAHGGGGHRLAAGFNIAGTIETARTLIISIFSEVFSG
jgi:phosphoesterase RecJ-like protein